SRLRFASCSSALTPAGRRTNGNAFFAPTSRRTPAYSGPREPAPCVHAPPQQSPGGVPRTQHSGRVALRVPRPEQTQEPIVGYAPSRTCRPVCHCSWAPWSLSLVHSERTTARSSAHSPTCFHQSATVRPHSPYFLNGVLRPISTLRPPCAGLAGATVSFAGFRRP